MIQQYLLFKIVIPLYQSDKGDFCYDLYTYNLLCKMVITYIYEPGFCLLIVQGLLCF